MLLNFYLGHFVMVIEPCISQVLRAGKGFQWKTHGDPEVFKAVEGQGSELQEKGMRVTGWIQRQDMESQTGKEQTQMADILPHSLIELGLRF